MSTNNGGHVVGNPKTTKRAGNELGNGKVVKGSLRKPAKKAKKKK